MVRMNSTLDLPNNLPLTGLVELYRNEACGSNPSTTAIVLLDRFQPYLQKWMKLLIFGRWDRKDKEIRHFLQMMGSMDIEKTCQIISLRLKAYDREDIEQELRLVFLQTALRTKSIRKHFRYALQKRIVKLLRDPLVYNHDLHVPLNESSHTCPVCIDIDELWVVGFTCGPGFDELTSHERRILQLHYYQGLTIEGTAKYLGISTATVSRVLSKTKRVLAVYYR